MYMLYGDKVYDSRANFNEAEMIGAEPIIRTLQADLKDHGAQAAREFFLILSCGRSTCMARGAVEAQREWWGMLHINNKRLNI